MRNPSQITAVLELHSSFTHQGVILSNQSRSLITQSAMFVLNHESRHHEWSALLQLDLTVCNYRASCLHQFGCDQWFLYLMRFTAPSPDTGWCLNSCLWLMVYDGYKNKYVFLKSWATSHQWLCSLPRKARSIYPVKYELPASWLSHVRTIFKTELNGRHYISISRNVHFPELITSLIDRPSLSWSVRCWWSTSFVYFYLVLKTMQLCLDQRFPL